MLSTRAQLEHMKKSIKVRCACCSCKNNMSHDYYLGMIVTIAVVLVIHVLKI